MVNLKRLIVLFVLVFLSGCVSAAQFAALEKEVASLKRAKPDAMLIADQAGAAKFHWRSALQGNTSSSIDGITGASNGDAAMMVALSGTTGTAYLYIYDADGTASDYPVSCTTECSRLQADGMGAGAWVLINWYTAKLVGAADDGYHYIQVKNTAAFADTPAEGMCYYKTTTSSWCCYDTDSWNCHVMVDND